MSEVIDSVRATRRWLIQLEPKTDVQHAYQELGLVLAECVIDRAAPTIPCAEGAILRLPDASVLVSMDRIALLELSRTYTGGERQASDGALVLPHLALSYARDDDLQAVAALLRLAVLAGADMRLSEDAWGYLYDQQQPDGSFGLLSAEVALLKRSEDAITPQLAMTVEVLWTLATAAATGESER